MGLDMAMNSEIEKLERRWQENPLGLTFASLAEAYRKSGDPAKALTLLEVGLSQHPNYVPAHIVRGRCYLDTQASAEAAQAFRRVVELDPENAIALKGLADLAEQDGRIPEAISRLEALLEVDRNNEEARGQLDRLREPASSQPGEFQLIDDAVSLSPDREPLPEIILHDLERVLPSPDAAQGRELLAPPDPLAAQGADPLSEQIAESVAAATGFTDFMDFIAEDRAEDTENTAALTTQPEAAPEPAAEAEAKPEATAEAKAEPEPAAEQQEPALVVTETMAEIFLRQGHRELALAVYSQLAQRDPANERVSAACARLQAELEPPQAEPVAAEAPVRYDAASTGGRSVAELFATLLASGRPTAAPAIHPPAFEAPPRPAGEPTRPAPESLSLSAVFGEEAAPAGPAGAGAPEEPAVSEPSFEQFFTPPEGSISEIELPKSPESEPPAMSAMAPEDLEQFNAWLRGLKR
ncbi:MAG TPA: tetratricopeptide repeat protein [Gemmatimonadales bacterium]|jgi:tetratricopeptide (TPR) repeat protein|nr:tetratricopeptide repeat protein [Gemmatimonadales bacterium]